MWKVPKIWENGQCIILGGGSSIPSQFDVPQKVIDGVFAGQNSPAAYSPYMSVLHDKHVIAVNMAFKIGDWIDCVFFGDSNFINIANNRSDLFEFKGLRVSCADKIEDYAHVIKILGRDRSKKLGISTNPSLVSWNYNSGAAAINLAVHFGVKKIILLGFDMNLDSNNNQHWHKVYDHSLDKIPELMKYHLSGFPMIARDLRTLGVEVINCSPNSAIECFPKMSIKEVFNE